MKKNTMMIDGFMTLGVTDSGLMTADFECCEDVEMEAHEALCKVQLMRDGNMYITERPPRKRNTPLFRQDNSSLSLGRNGRYYFVFSLPQEQVGELSERLVSQANEVARKIQSRLWRL